MTNGAAEGPAPADGGFGTMRIEAPARGNSFELARPALTREPARAMAVRTALFAIIPALSMVAVFYNTRLALYLCFLLLTVHFLPGRVDVPAELQDGR